jgi:hypothetical protein
VSGALLGEGVPWDGVEESHIGGSDGVREGLDMRWEVDQKGRQTRREVERQRKYAQESTAAVWSAVPTLSRMAYLSLVDRLSEKLMVILEHRLAYFQFMTFSLGELKVS